MFMNLFSIGVKQKFWFVNKRFPKLDVTYMYKLFKCREILCFTVLSHSVINYLLNSAYISYEIILLCQYDGSAGKVTLCAKQIT